MNLYFDTSIFESSLFFELSLVIAIGALVAIVMRMLRQPLIVSHILTGLIVGPFFLNFIHSMEIFKLFSEIGIAILLFTVGLNLSPHLIKQFGKISLFTGLGQVIITSALGYTISRILGYESTVSIYIGLALAFSSTIIILKLLSDKNELESLHAKIATGFLLVQDFIALILLFSIPIISNPQATSLDIITTFFKGAIMAGIVWLIANKILKPLNNFFSHSQELLFLFSLSWGFVIASVFKLAGFSLETGALIAGVSLAALPARHEISARLVPLRDFFIVLFFIMLGAQMAFGDIVTLFPKALIFSLVIIIGNLLILMIIMRAFGYRKQTSFKTALNVTQISEFSLILITLGVSLGHLEPSILATITLVALITIFISSYLILHSDSIYLLLEEWLQIFEKKYPNEKAYRSKNSPIILFGCNRIGYDFVDTFSKQNKKFLVIDYNPETIAELEVVGVRAEYGDASDISFLENIDTSKLELLISTIPSFSSNQLIVETIRKKNKKAIIMMIAHTIDDALALYDLGVDYVILPHFLGGQYAADIILKIGTNRRRFASLKDKHLNYLQEKVSLGHKHPEHIN
jgi:Kef-type K+ transport system membrane component KefB/Trk K+ transport system NAD-binding subunit